MSLTTFQRLSATTRDSPFLFRAMLFNISSRVLGEQSIPSSRFSAGQEEEEEEEEENLLPYLSRFT